MSSYFHQQTSLFDEEYHDYRIPQSEGPIKYVLSGPRGGVHNEYTKRVVHHVGQTDIDRPVLTNLNDLVEYNTELVGRSPLMTRHIFDKESQYEGFLRPISSGKTFLDYPIDRFNPNLLEVQVPSDMWFQAGAGTRADLRNDSLNQRMQMQGC